MLKTFKSKIRNLIREETKKAIKETIKSGETLKYLTDAISHESKDIQSTIKKNAIKLENRLSSNEVHINATENQIEDLKHLINKNKSEVNSVELQSVERQALKAISSDDYQATYVEVKRLADAKKRSNASFISTADRIRAAIQKKKDKSGYEDSSKTLFYLHSIDEFSWRDFADVYKNRYPVMQASSLVQQYVRRRRMRQIGNVPERWLPYNKECGVKFAELCGIKTPNSAFNMRIEDITPSTDIVVKPMKGRGSIATYIIRESDNIYVPNKQSILHSWDEMIADANTYVNAGTIENLFMTQELIYSDKAKKTLANDLKFYTFYGEIGCVNEISRDPALAYWWYRPDGSPIDIGIKNPDGPRAIGFTEEQLQQVVELSLKIPAPHVRIDFLVGEDGIYLAEFTTQTGSQVERILEVVSESWNRSMGTMYLKAEMRIVNDLLEGKCFREINEFNQMCESKYR